MDLVPTSGTPLPPAPISGNGSTGAATNRGLVVALGAIHDSAGQTVPTRVLPGDIPAIQVAPADLLDVATHLRDDLGFDLLSCVSGVDLVEYRQVVYHLRATARNWLLEMKVDVPTDSNMVDTVMGVWPTANWLERETYDMMGILFAGHPDLRRILLDDEFVGHPQLKSFRPTPLAVHDRATTGTDGQRAIAGESQRGLGAQRAVPSHLSQGDQERLHPGTPTFGSTQFHGRSFPPQTWKHQPDYSGSGSEHTEEDKK
jgi:NADH/F420H2 dehydrogenase subunit C